MAKNNKAPSDKTSKKDKPDEKSAPEQDRDKKLAGKFKSEKELAEAYKNLEEKLGEMSEEVSRGREFAAAVKPLLDTIRADPELFRQLDERLREGEKADTPDNKSKVKKDEKTDDQEIRNVASDLILARFEEKYGIDKLSPDKRKSVRQAIGDAIYGLTGKSLDGRRENRVDLRRLDSTLENAYIVAKEKMNKSTLEALKKASEATEGGIPSVPSSPKTGKSELSSEEADVASKLGLTREEYLTGKKV